MNAVFLEYGIDGIAMGILSFCHLVGLVLGLGTTVYLDGGCFLSIARNSWEGYRDFMSGALFSIATKYVMVGLGILWLSGCGFLIHYAIFSPDKLANPKLLAKLAFVTVLTINGYCLHYLVLRRVAKMSKCSLFLKSRMGPLCLFSGAVSSASWIGAFLLGALPILNNAVTFSMFVLVWAMLALVVYFCARAAIGFSLRHDRRRDRATLAPVGPGQLDGAMIGPAPCQAVAANTDGYATVILATAFAAKAGRGR